MNIRAALSWMCCGVAAGAVIGAATVQLGSLRPAVRAQNGIAGESKASSSFSGAIPMEPGDNERLVRLFSAYQTPTELRRNAEIFEALRDLQPGDFRSLADRAERLGFRRKNELMPALLARWFTVDFANAQDWMLANPEASHLEQWARANPEAALAAAVAATNDPRSAKLLTLSLQEIYGDDFAGQLARLKSLPPGVPKDSASEDALIKWSEVNPAAAFAAFTQIEFFRPFARIRWRLLENWAEKDPAGALAQLDALIPRLKAGVVGNNRVAGLVEKIAAKDREMVLAWLATLPAEFRTASAIATARAWAETEPVAALEWCLANGVRGAFAAPPLTLNMARASAWRPGVLGVAMAAEPAKTVEWLEALPAGANRNRLLELALHNSFFHTPHEQLFGGDDPLALRLFRQLDPDGQISKATELGRQRTSRGDLIDLDAWARSFSPGEARANAVAGAMEGLTARDAFSAEKLLASTTTGADRDAALRGMAGALHTTAPAAAASRALSITGQDARRETLDTVMSAWLKRDRETASAWLRESARIPEAWKHAWLEKR